MSTNDPFQCRIDKPMNKKSEQHSADDKAQRLREYLDEIHRRNERSGQQRERLAGSPEVGIFWVVDGRLILAGAWIEEATTRGRFAHYPTTHEREWAFCQRANAVPLDVAYDEPPRGRVSFDKVTQQFHMFADACILSDQAMVEKIRKDLNLTSEIKIGLDNFYQCAACLGLSARDVNGAPPKRTRKHGFALNRENYISHLRPMLSAALWEFFHTPIIQLADSKYVDTLWANEAERRMEVQIPSFISVAPTNGRFSRANAIEEAISAVKKDKKSFQIWERVIDGVARALKTDRSTLPLPDQSELQHLFFSRVGANCAAALKGTYPVRLSARPLDVFVVWDYVSAALTYCYQKEIAVANGYLKRITWFDDRVGFYLESRLVDWISSTGRRAKIDVASAIRAGIDLVPVDNIWEFGINEIARQIDRPAQVDELCAAALRCDHNVTNGTE